MEITYVLGDSLYVNMTNRCTNDCTFCVRNQSDSIGSALNLWLQREPTREEVLEDILSHELKNYSELVFCGFGEPTCRLLDMLWVCAEVKKHFNINVRVNTNGHASLILGYDTAPLFEGLVDTVSVSLNAKNAQDYAEICHPQHGEAAFDAMLSFAEHVKAYVGRVVLSVVDTLPQDDIAVCEDIARARGIELRVRNLIT